MADVNEVLTLIKGSTRDFDVYLFKEDDTPEVLSVFDQATFTLREEDSAANLLLRRTADGNLTINAAASKLSATLTQVEADGLKAGAGTLIAMVSLRRQSNGKWEDCDRIKVRILSSFATHTP